IERPRARVEARDVARVIVDPEKIDRLADEIQILGRPSRPGITENLRELVRITAEEYRIEILPVHVRVRASPGVAILGLLGSRIFRLEVYHDPDAMLALDAIRLHGG